MIRLKKSIGYLLFFALLVAIRGFGLATFSGGRYPSRSFLTDTLALCVLMGVCHLAYACFQRIVKRFTWNSAAILQTYKIIFVVFCVFPFLLTFIQLHPQKIVSVGSPSVNFELVVLTADNITLRGWLLNPMGRHPPLLLLHGLNANKGNFLPIAERFAAYDFPVLIFDFRAHGESDGRLTTFGLNEKNDVRAASRWLKTRFPGSKVYALGYSLGGSALLQYSVEEFPFDRIVIDATFASLKDTAAAKLFPLAGYFKNPLCRLLGFWAEILSGSDLMELSNIPAISKLDSSKVLLIHGEADSMIPISESEALRSATNPPILLWRIPNANHLGTIYDPKYFAGVSKFLLEGRYD